MSDKTILIVEDTEDDVFFLKRALKDSGIHHPHSVVVDGQQALDYFQGKGEYADRSKYPIPFLVLLDLKLPYVMGLEVLKWIREQPEYNSTLIVVLTSSQQNSDMEETFRLGGNAYLIKPPTRVKLLEMIENLRDKWLSE
jgi:CheY-like chemotaxis protein